MKIHLLTVVGKFVGLLPQMIEHYQDLGITSFQIHVHITHPNDPVLPQVKTVVESYGIKIASVCTDSTWIEAQDRVFRESMERQAEDWFVIADQDEFQVYSRDLETIISECESAGHDHIYGCFVDRLGPNGTLPRPNNDVSLWDQFPIGAYVSNPVAGGFPRKVVAALGRVKIQGSGCHYAMSLGTPCPVDMYHIQIHHFKWVDTLVERLLERVEIIRKVDYHWRESQRIIDYLDFHQGRIDIDDPRIMAAPCGRHYPEWERVTWLCQHAESVRLLPNVILPPSGSTPIRLNVGGFSFDDWLGDLAGIIRSTQSEIQLSGVEDPAPAVVYSSNRYGEFSYAFGELVAGKEYNVRLHFAEINYKHMDERLITVSINRKPILQHFDVLKAAGGKNRAYVVSRPTRADKYGFVIVDLIGTWSGMAMISGIEVTER